MKKILMILSMCVCLSGCTPILLGLALSSSVPRMNFKVDGEIYRAEDRNVGTFRIFEVEGKGFAISYNSAIWDSENTLKGAQIGLYCGFFDGTLEKDVEYVFSSDDGLDTYPFFRYSKTELAESTAESSVSRSQSFWCSASNGWFKITKLNKKDGVISGSFAFDAVCDDPSLDEVVEITDGVFRNVPYVLVQDDGQMQ